MDEKYVYGSKLKFERKKRSLTQREVAQKIGISRSYYSDIENGRRFPSGKLIFEINKVIPIFLILNDVNSYGLEGIK